MSAKATNVAVVTSAKLQMPSQAEAERAAWGLHLIAEDSEASLSVRGEAVLLARQLEMSVSNASSREELVRRGHSLAGRA